MPTLNPRRQYWFSFFSTKRTFAFQDQKLTPAEADQHCSELARSYQDRVECYQGTSEKLDGSERPFCIKFPAAEWTGPATEGLG